MIDESLLGFLYPLVPLRVVEAVLGPELAPLQDYLVAGFPVVLLEELLFDVPAIIRRHIVLFLDFLNHLNFGAHALVFAILPAAFFNPKRLQYLVVILLDLMGSLKRLF